MNIDVDVLEDLAQELRRAAQTNDTEAGRAPTFVNDAPTHTMIAHYRTKADTYRDAARRLERTRRNWIREAQEVAINLKADDQASGSLGKIDRELSRASRPPPGTPDRPPMKYCQACGDAYLLGFWHRFYEGHWPTA